MPIIEINGNPVHFLTGHATRPTDGEGILLIHGAGSSSLIWLSQRRALGESAFACALDLPGHGQSGGTASDSISDYAAFIRQFILALEMERVSLVGHSMGGAIAMQLAMEYPDLVARLVLVGTGAKLGVTKAILTGLTADFDRTMEMMREFAFSPKTNPSVIDPVIAQMKQGDPASALADFTACDRFDRRGDLAAIGVPALIVCGEDDLLTPVKYSQYLHEGIQGSGLRVIPEAGHMIMVEKPEQVNSALVDFLSGGG